MSTGHNSELLELARSDDRFACEAYEFLGFALAYTQKQLGKAPLPSGEKGEHDMKTYHVTGQQLLEGIREFALQQFGMMAPVVFRLWGVQRTSDFGEMVYRLIDAGLWHKSPDDRLGDFEDLYDFDEVFVRDFKFDEEDLA